MRPHGERKPPTARKLYRDRTLILNGVDLDGKAHGGAAPGKNELAARTLGGGALQHGLPLSHGPLDGLTAHPQPPDRHGRRSAGHTTRGNHGTGAGMRRPRLGELDHDAEGLLGVEKSLLPLRIGVIAADDPVAGGLRAGAGLRDARHLEGQVMEARASLGQKAMEKARRPRGLHDLDRSAALETIGAPPEDARGLARVRHAAQLAGEKRSGIGHSRQGDGNVVEENAIHPAHRVKTSVAASRARSMPCARASRWVTARIVRGPMAPMRTPRERSCSTAAGAPIEPVRSKKTILVSMVVGSSERPGRVASPSARRFALTWSSASRLTWWRRAYTPPAAMMPAWRMAPPICCLQRHASSMNAREPARTAPTGAPRPFVKSIHAESKKAA